MHKIDGIDNWILVIMAAVSFTSMITALNIDALVSQELPSYGF